MRLPGASLLVLLLLLAAAAPGLADCLDSVARPVAFNGAGEARPRIPRYTVIDLGLDVSPYRLSADGWVLLYDAAGQAYRWKNGVRELLTSNLPGAAYGLHVTDMNANGDVLGGVANGNFNWFVTTAGDYDTVLLWMANSATAVALPNPYAIPAQVGEGVVRCAGPTILSDSGTAYGLIYEGLGGYSDGISNSSYPLMNTFAWPNLVALPVKLSTAARGPVYEPWTGYMLAILQANGTGHFIGYRQMPLPFYQDNVAIASTPVFDETPLPFDPLYLNDAGQVLGYEAAAGHILLWDGTNHDLGPGYPYAINNRRITALNTNGQPIEIFSRQILGYLGTHPAIWEPCLETGDYRPALLDEMLLDPNHWQMTSVARLNDHGCIIGTARFQPLDASGRPNAAAENHGVLLLPVELRDSKDDGDADDQVIDTVQRVPTQDLGESNQAFWRRRNAYFQQQVPDRSIAYIEPHRAANDSPDMTRLVARIPGGQHGLRVKWRLEVESLRGNGYRADYVEDFTRPEDKVLIPAAGQGGNPVFTAEMEVNQEWRIFETQDWLNEIQQRGFFGGTGKLYLWPPGQLDAPTEPIVTFRIGGKNPDQLLARQFIDQSAGVQFWYAYAIARHETFGRVRVNGQIRFYNEFYTEYQGGPIGDASVDMGWAAWAKGAPLYNLDRDRRRDGTRYQNGPGGYGMYQLTWGPKHPNDAQGTGANAFIPRRMVWNWQDNVNGAITELEEKVAAAEALRNGLQAAYPQWPAIPNEGHLSSLEAIIVTFYNGTAGLPLRKINGANRKTPWTAEIAGQTRIWRFHQNSQNYVQSVNARINNTMP